MLEGYCDALRQHLRALREERSWMLEGTSTTQLPEEDAERVRELSRQIREIEEELGC